MSVHRHSWAECTARERLDALVDAGSFHEWLPPAERVSSPHLAALGLPQAFDDGVAVGRATLDGRPIFVAAQEGGFIGGGVGEVHGAKLCGWLARALRERPQAVILCADSGGVRLHEANAGLIAVSEVMRALLDVRAAGIPVIVLIGGAAGCFGGMGIVAGCADWRVISVTGRLSMSGPEVIEAAHGVEEFDSRDRALVWRTTGGKHRYLIGDADELVDDDVAAFRAAARAALDRPPRRNDLTARQAEQALLTRRLALAGEVREARELWAAMGLADAGRVPDLGVDAVRGLRATLEDAARTGIAGAEQPARPATATPSATGSADWATLCTALFGPGHGVQADGWFLHGTATPRGGTQPLAVIGTTDHAPIGAALALRQAAAVLDVLARHPGRAIVLLIDTQGQQLRRQDELLGIHRAMAHLGQCIDLARRRGHRVLGLVYDQALSGGFITSGLMADACDALPQAEIRVMRLPSMARVTKLPESRLAELAQSNPVFAPGVEHYVAMGGVRRLWRGDLAAALRQALVDAEVEDGAGRGASGAASGATATVTTTAPTPPDLRARLGAERGGRRLAATTRDRVLAAP
ncbi:MAG: hypothetical protein RIQ53_2813 [Pseudomonadota bacterium]